MLKFIKTTAIATALAAASTGAFAGEQFTVSTALDAAGEAYSAVEWVADGFAGSYIERVTISPDGSGGLEFIAKLFLPLSSATLDGVEVQASVTQGLGSDFGQGYGLYSFIELTGDIGTDAAGNFVISDFDGSFNVWFDKNADSLPLNTAALEAGNLDPQLANAATASDDVLLASAGSLGGAALIGPSTGSFGVSADDFLLTAAGESFFIAPRPFYIELTSTGDLGNIAAPIFALATDALNNGNTGSVWVSEEASVEFVPEPSSLALIGLGLIGAGFASRKKKK